MKKAIILVLMLLVVFLPVYGEDGEDIVYIVTRETPLMTSYSNKSVIRTLEKGERVYFMETQPRGYFE
jgi:hypothetical protein